MFLKGSSNLLLLDGGLKLELIQNQRGTLHGVLPSYVYMMTLMFNNSKTKANKLAKPHLHPVRSCQRYTEV